MSNAKDVVVIQGGRVIDPASGVDGVRTVVLRDGKVAEVAERVERARRRAGGRRPRASGSRPGFIDLHVHLREPGQEYKETIATGARGRGGGRLHLGRVPCPTPSRSTTTPA